MIAGRGSVPTFPCNWSLGSMSSIKINNKLSPAKQQMSISRMIDLDFLPLLLYTNLPALGSLRHRCGRPWVCAIGQHLLGPGVFWSYEIWDGSLVLRVGATSRIASKCWDFTVRHKGWKPGSTTYWLVVLGKLFNVLHLILWPMNWRGQ
jgi:hypothetical protein